MGGWRLEIKGIIFKDKMLSTLFVFILWLETKLSVHWMIEFNIDWVGCKCSMGFFFFFFFVYFSSFLCN